MGSKGSEGSGGWNDNNYTPISCDFTLDKRRFPPPFFFLKLPNPLRLDMALQKVKDMGPFLASSAE